MGKANNVFKKIYRFPMGFVVVICLISLSVYLYPKPSYEVFKIKPFETRLAANRIFENSSVLPDTHRPKILIWAKQYHSIGWTFPDLPGGEGGCDITWDRKEFPISDAVVFYMKSCKSNDLPNPYARSRFQAFVWWAHESPWTVLNYYKHKLNDFNGYFNWTMTYRRDADVLAAFAPTPTIDYMLYKFDRRDEIKDKSLLTHPTMTQLEFEHQTKQMLAGKSNLIAWIASDCSITTGATKRLKLVDKMSENGLLKIDRYGKCGTKKIAMNFTLLLQTLSTYKFYIAFENSFHCRDYVTEKSLYNALVSAAVPIVLGPSKEDTATVLPTDSFIHMDDYDDVTELAQYLKYLDKNDGAYLKFFEWWKDPGTHVIPRFGYNYGSGTSKKFNNGWKWRDAIQDDMMEIERFGLYSLCRKLRKLDHLRKTKTIPNLHDLWYEGDNKECYTK